MRMMDESDSEHVAVYQRHPECLKELVCGMEKRAAAAAAAAAEEDHRLVMLLFQLYFVRSHRSSHHLHRWKMHQRYCHYYCSF